MTLLASMQYVRALVATTTWPTSMLELPSPPGNILTNLTPPDPNVPASSPTVSIWFLRFGESRGNSRLQGGTIPRAQYEGGPSGTKVVEHTAALYVAWAGTGPTDPNQDTLFPGMVDRIRATLRVSAVQAKITDPWTGEESWLVDVGELIDGATFLEALMPQRLNRYDTLLTCSVTEIIAA